VVKSIEHKIYPDSKLPPTETSLKAASNAVPALNKLTC